MIARLDEDAKLDLLTSTGDRSQRPPDVLSDLVCHPSFAPSDLKKEKQVVIQEIHMSEDQLEQEILNLKKEQFNLRFQRATGQLQDTTRVRVVRRDIARAKTIAAQRRTAEGKTKREALRSLKRQVSNAAYRQLLLDAKRARS